jgi:hypothetical protein
MENGSPKPFALEKILSGTWSVASRLGKDVEFVNNATHTTATVLWDIDLGILPAPTHSSLNYIPGLDRMCRV